MAEEKKTRYTPEQQAVIDCPGNVIVSASAGSGKTTVMIERLLNAILSGAKLDEVLCVTFTKKAAANMKEKLRKKLISALGETTDGRQKKHLKDQLAAIPTADISTIHSFCSQLIRRYFYILGCDGAFDIVSSDDSQFKEYIDRAFENLFDRLYEENDPDFMLLLQFLRRKRKDDSVKAIILEAYFAARAVSHYREKIEASLKKYTPEGFREICAGLQAANSEKYQALEDVLYDFQLSFIPLMNCMPGAKVRAYTDLFTDMYLTLEQAKTAGAFDPVPTSISSLRKPVDGKYAPAEVKTAGEYFKNKKDELNRKYKSVRGDIEDEDTEYARFLKSGELARAFANILLQFDDEFAAVKHDENKLDYNDLEHYSLEILSNKEVLSEIQAKYAYVFVDEYQDVNPVQEEIISAIGGKIFLVGDVKQAIYGFRGSKSKFFSDKFDTFESEGGHALRIPTNFRSADGIIKAVNDMFSASMTQIICGFDYKAFLPDIASAGSAEASADPDSAEDFLSPAGTEPASGMQFDSSFTDANGDSLALHVMPVSRASKPARKTRSETRDDETMDELARAHQMAAEAAKRFVTVPNPSEQGHEMKACEGWPENAGNVYMHEFGEEQKEDIEPKVYSVKEDAKAHKETLEAKAIVKLIRSLYGKMRYDKDLRREVPTQYGDICILARKNKALESIVSALIAEKIPVSGAQKGNICDTPEVKQMLDILSVIDNSEQDIALITALLSPLGKFTENELAVIKTSMTGKTSSFRECCKIYMRKDNENADKALAAKLSGFYDKLDGFQQAAGVLSAGTLITRILSETGLEAEYSAGGGEALRNVLRLMQEGPDLTLSGFLRKIREGGYSIGSPACAPSDCVQVMTMHASKGLEFPVVIIADICKLFSGSDTKDIYFDETFGFAPRCYNEMDRTYSDTILRKYVRGSRLREDIKNELNLFYVACTRAETELHIMTSVSVPEYNTAAALSARNYAALIDFDFPSIQQKPMLEVSESAPADSGTESAPDTAASTSAASISAGETAESPTYFAPDDNESADADHTAEGEKLREPMSFDDLLADPLKYGDMFEKPYAYPGSVNLPVKTSASNILKAYNSMDDESEDIRNLFSKEEEQDEGEVKKSDPTGIPRGTAYHRFLELCNFSVRDIDGITGEILNFISMDLMTAEQAGYLVPGELAEILNFPVFAGLETAQTMREQEFLCRMPACKIMDTTAEDPVLVQGAIDLLICQDGKYHIVDYKYSHKDPDLLRATYAPQLKLYRTAVSIITGIPEEEIPATIVNIHRRYAPVEI